MPALNLDSNYLLAQCLWGGIASGYFVYGWKQKSPPAFAGGAALMGVCYFIESPLLMSLASVAVMVGVYYWAKRY